MLVSGCSYSLSIKARDIAWVIIIVYVLSWDTYRDAKFPVEFA